MSLQKMIYGTLIAILYLLLLWFFIIFHTEYIGDTIINRLDFSQNALQRGYSNILGVRPLFFGILCIIFILEACYVRKRVGKIILLLNIFFGGFIGWYLMSIDYRVTVLFWHSHMIQYMAIYFIIKIIIFTLIKRYFSMQDDYG